MNIKVLKEAIQRKLLKQWQYRRTVTWLDKIDLGWKLIIVSFHRS
jgi:hypothetical protein